MTSMYLEDSIDLVFPTHLNLCLELLDKNVDHMGHPYIILKKTH